MKHADQLVFDTVLAHLRAQGCAAIDNIRCSYRTPGGKKCAIGCLIPDDRYTPDLEGKNVTDNVVRCSIENRYQYASIDLLSDLQNAHDCILRPRGMGKWELRMKAIAERFGLRYTP